MTPPIAIIPQPQSLIRREETLALPATSVISWRGDGAGEVAELLAAYLRPATGFPWPVEAGTHGTIQLHATGAAIRDAAGFTDESYRLTVDQANARLEAASATGLARGIQTLRQLLPSAIFASDPQDTDWILPGVAIDDRPRFRWRGQHLDVSRHFFSVEAVCGFIDILALHRLNICHLHLTDDQGWRIEIKQYPLLTGVGSRRDCTLIGHESARPRRYDATPYGGFYTQDDIQQIVAFAARRHITLVPEIDMPGHMVAAISAYPELGNLKLQTQVRRHWGISQNVLNVEDATIAFMKDVLTEVMELFPGTFIHVGGDEAPKHEWSECPRAQERMAELGLKDEHELQSWFIRQLNDHIRAAGRIMIGWNEIMEGGLAAGATVMSWQGEAGGIAAAEHHHDAVMSPTQWTYFDFYQAYPLAEEPLAIGGMNATDHVYAYEPVPAALAPELHAHILGGQGQLWTEYMPDIESVYYMGFPRICALAEVLWLDADKKNYVGFLERLHRHRDRLATLGIRPHPRP